VDQHQDASFFVTALIIHSLGNDFKISLHFLLRRFNFAGAFIFCPSEEDNPEVRAATVFKPD